MAIPQEVNSGTCPTGPAFPETQRGTGQARHRSVSRSHDLGQRFAAIHAELFPAVAVPSPHVGFNKMHPAQRRVHAPHHRAGAAAHHRHGPCLDEENWGRSCRSSLRGRRCGRLTAGCHFEANPRISMELFRKRISGRQPINAAPSPSSLPGGSATPAPRWRARCGFP